MEENVLAAEPRTEFGSRMASRLRAEGRLPANIYGHGGEHLHVTLNAKAFEKFLNEGHRIATLKVGTTVERGLVKEVQYDALGSNILHVDFARIRMDQAVEIAVPIEALGIPKGVSGGGVLSFTVQELVMSGLPDAIPKNYPLSIEALEIGQSLRLKDLAPPPGCKIMGDPETVIVAVMQKREEVAPAAPVEAAPAQPEVIGRKKEVEEEPEEAGKSGKPEKPEKSEKPEKK